MHKFMLAYRVTVFGRSKAIQIGPLYTRTYSSVHFHIVILEKHKPYAYTQHSIGESAVMFTGEIDHVAIVRSRDDFYVLC